MANTSWCERERERELSLFMQPKNRHCDLTHDSAAAQSFYRQIVNTRWPSLFSAVSDGPVHVHVHVHVHVISILSTNKSTKKIEKLPGEGQAIN